MNAALNHSMTHACHLMCAISCCNPVYHFRSGNRFFSSLGCCISQNRLVWLVAMGIFSGLIGDLVLFMSGKKEPWNAIAGLKDQGLS